MIIHFIRHLWNRLFEVPDEPRSLIDVIAWWELRRIAYNFIIGSVGAVSLVIFFISILSTGILEPGEDAVEPMALIAAPIVINICYYAGSVAEIILRVLWPRKRSYFGPILLKLGLAFSLLIVTFPALFWSGYRLLQICGVLK